MPQWFAAVDFDTRAVHGLGLDTPENALVDAADQGADVEGLEVVPCTSEAAMELIDGSGAPDRDRFDIDRRLGVRLVSEIE